MSTLAVVSTDELAMLTGFFQTNYFHLKAHNNVVCDYRCMILVMSMQSAMRPLSTTASALLDSLGMEHTVKVSETAQDVLHTKCGRVRNSNACMSE